ncbi:MAG TPA: energy-coupling factor ABC transporter ATP-binding protein [Bacillales bacterium]|nr:energy-coupling factor ABC transporter ATP-binding protein [Bacillales bacterium]
MDITIKQLEHRYGVGTPFERTALKNVNLTVQSGTFLALIGHTGSGKSSLIQHMNGLLKPTAGSVSVGDFTIHAGEKNKHLKALRKKVGMVFQYPEHQLFDETVEKDICFGPMNFGLSERAAKQKAREVSDLVGLSGHLLPKSPFDLSGGQMRRVAIAGVLAMEPEVLILDEPTAGLDPRGQREIMGMFHRLHREKGLTTILVTHSMEDVAAYADEVVIMNRGTVYFKGTPKQVFAEPGRLQNIGLDIPETTRFIMRLEKAFGVSLPKDRFSVEGVAELVERLVQKGAGTR